MNKTSVIFFALIGIAVAVAVIFNRDAQLQRARATVLAERLAELEPVERSDNTAAVRSIERTTKDTPPQDLSIERGDARSAPISTSQEEPRQPRTSYPGSKQARAQVDRLQAALVDGTPLQEYQIRGLIAAIDRVRNEIDQEQRAATGERTMTTNDRMAERNERLIQAAADILFESQLERFIELMKAESDAAR